MPGQFIAEAEETGLISSLGSQVMRAACHFGASLNGTVRRPLSMSVNVSSRQLRQPDFVDQVETILVTTGMDPKNLVIELTETALIENADTAVAMLDRIREFGVRVHLDDFGNGYSSLSYLQRFPIDRLKIDKSFVAGLASSREDQAIVRAILSLADSLGKGVVAEGIETQDQLERLQGMQCAFGQGYLFSRALSETDAHALAVGRMMAAAEA